MRTVLHGTRLRRSRPISSPHKPKLSLNSKNHHRPSFWCVSVFFYCSNVYKEILTLMDGNMERVPPFRRMWNGKLKWLECVCVCVWLGAYVFFCMCVCLAQFSAIGFLWWRWRIVAYYRWNVSALWSSGIICLKSILDRERLALDQDRADYTHSL